MKKLYRLLLLMSIVTACSGAADGIHNLTICSTTDLHGAYFDSLYDGNTLRKTSLSRVSQYVKSVRNNGGNLVLIDIGDNLQGDPAAYYFNYVNTTDEHVCERAFKYLGYDAVVVGNHDLEAGHSVYDRFRKDIGIPYLAANTVITEGEKKGEPYFDQYTIVERDGIKVAVIGMTNSCIKMWISSKLYEGIDFMPIADVTQQIVDQVMEKENPHIVVLGLHSGVGTGRDDDLEDASLAVAKSVKGVDIIFCGHDHHPDARVVENPSGNVILLDGGSRASVVAQCLATIEIKKGKVVDKHFDYRLIPMADCESDTAYNTTFAPDFEEVKEFANEEIGELKETIHMADALYGPSAYLHLIHTVQNESSGADISIASPLSTGGEIKAGKLKFLDLVTIYPFENQLYVIKMTGDQIKNYLEYSYDNWIKGNGPSFNYDSAEGINYTVSKSAAYGERVHIISMQNGEKFDPEKSYKVAMTSYRFSGAGGMLEEGAGIDQNQIKDLLVDILPEIRVLLNDYIVAKKEIFPKREDNWSFVR